MYSENITRYSQNITREEARDRSDLLRTQTYRVEFDLSGRDFSGVDLTHPEENFVSRSTVTFTSEAGETWIDLLAAEVVEATLDGVALDPASFTGARLPLELTAGEHELSVTALCRYSHTGEGLHRFVDPADERIYLYTQFEVADARRAYACFDQPDLKATFELSVTAPRDWTVISNAAAVEPQPVGDDLGRWDFEPTLALPTYLTALVAGHYHRVESVYAGPHGDIPLSLLCRQSLVEHLDTDRLFATTTSGFEVFERAFGTPYAFGTYDQAFVPEFNAGAMENAGCVTYRDDYLFRSRVTEAAYESRDNTILHEMAHMWFGDLVTMAWWDDLWLNESFAEWASHFAAAEFHSDPLQPWVTFATQRKTWAYRQDQLPTTHPVAADMVDLAAVESNFDGITYAKGASALRQLVAYVGRENFLTGVQQYFRDHAFGNTTQHDLFTALEAASGRDLSQWSQQWLEAPGVSTLSADFATDDQDIFTSFVVHQQVPDAFPVHRMHRMAIGLYERGAEGRLTRVDRVEVDVDGPATEVPELVGRRRTDLVLLNDDDLTYAKVRLDSRSLATAAAHLRDIESPLARALCWAGLWDMTRDGQIPAADYVTTVLAHVGAESDPTAAQRSLGQATRAIFSYALPAQRPELISDMESGLAALIAGAEPGSDHQLIFARALIGVAASPTAADLMRALLDGEEAIPGLVIDTELRWALLRNLARLGQASLQEINDEAEADRTIAGAQHAAGARAALPDEVEKAEAWRLATAADDVPNETQRSICADFWQPGQEELLAPYAQRFLDVIEVMAAGLAGWQTKGTALRENVLTYLFPEPLADEEFIATLDQFTDEHELNTPIRRSLAESRDDALRALFAREQTAARERSAAPEEADADPAPRPVPVADQGLVELAAGDGSDDDAQWKPARPEEASPHEALQQ